MEVSEGVSSKESEDGQADELLRSPAQGVVEEALHSLNKRVNQYFEMLALRMRHTIRDRLNTDVRFCFINFKLILIKCS